MVMIKVGMMSYSCHSSFTSLVSKKIRNVVILPGIMPLEFIKETCVMCESGNGSDETRNALIFQLQSKGDVNRIRNVGILLRPKFIKKSHFRL